MTPNDLAALHRLAFTSERPWSTAEFASLLEDPNVTLLSRPQGFALARTVAEESELLTLAVHPGPPAPKHRRRRLSPSGLLTAKAIIAFLEVAADNHAARGALQQAWIRRERPAKGLLSARRHDAGGCGADDGGIAAWSVG